ncbi:MAG: hypothetical protein WKG01_04910 [Kofleriaceae bacterium]
MRHIVLVLAVAACKKSPPPEPAPQPPGPGDAMPAPDAAIEATIDATIAMPAPKGTLLISSSGGLQAMQVGGEHLQGMRVEVFGSGGKLCDAVVGAATIGTCKVTTVALTASGPCDGAIYARAPGDLLAVVMPVSATRQQRAAAERWFEDNPYRLANEAVELNGLDPKTLPELEVAQALAQQGLRGMTLMFAEADGRRKLHTAGWKDARGAAIGEVSAAVAAPAPSRVLGADVDGDGATDALVSHAQGAALVFGADRPPVTTICD